MTLGIPQDKLNYNKELARKIVTFFNASKNIEGISSFAVFLREAMKFLIIFVMLAPCVTKCEIISAAR